MLLHKMSQYPPPKATQKFIEGILNVLLSLEDKLTKERLEEEASIKAISSKIGDQVERF